MLYANEYIDNNIDLEIGIQECAGEPFDEEEVDPLDAVLTFVKESEENWNSITRGIAFPELKYYTENGNYMVYTEADAGSFIEAVKRFFKGVLEKLKGLFNKFKANIMKLFAQDKTFVSKYKSEVIGKTITYKGYKFTTGLDKFAIGQNVNKAKVSVDAINKEQVSDTEELNNKLRGLVLGKGGDFTASEFSKELFSIFRNGESSKSSLTFKGSEQIKIIEGAKDRITKAGKAYDGIASSINKMITDLNSQANKELKKDDPNSDTITILHAKVTSYKNIINYAQIANGALLSALKAERAQAKTICVKLIGKKSENNSTNESFNFMTDDVKSSLSNIEFI